MNLIDCSYYYVGTLQIENARPLDDLDNNAHAVQELIDAYIGRYQPDFLRKMLGDALKAQVEAYLDAGTIGDMEELCERLRLPFAHYVYYKLAGDVNQNLTATGLVVFKSANTHQSPRQRMVKVWNEMVELNREFVKWAESSDYDVYYYDEMIIPINEFNI